MGLVNIAAVPQMEKGQISWRTTTSLKEQQTILMLSGLCQNQFLFFTKYCSIYFKLFIWAHHNYYFFHSCAFV